MAGWVKNAAAGLILAVLISWLLPFRAQAALTAITVEQVRIDQPQVDVFCYDNTGILDERFEASAYLDGEKLSYISATGASDCSIVYTILLDVSGSIRQEYMDEIKAQIGELAGQLGDNDTITIIAFGSSVKTLTANCGDAAQIEAALAKVQCTDQETHLYEAFEEGTEYTAAADGASRRIMIVVSDGIQATYSNGITASEIEEQLKSAGIPVFALCVDYASQEAKEEFGTFARATGGSFCEFGRKNAAAVWQSLVEQLNQCRILRFENENNLVDGGTHTLLLKLKAADVEESYTQTVELQHWKPDTTAPEIEAAVYDSERNAILLQFSELVQNAEKPENYQIQLDEGKNIAVHAVLQEEGQYVILLAEKPDPGAYTVAVTNVTDYSMEQNPLQENIAGFSVAAEGFSAKSIAAIAAAAAALLAVLVLWIVWLRRKASDKKQKEAVPEAEYTVHPVIVSGKPECPETAKGPVARMLICKMGASGITEQQELQIARSSIWGRSMEMCDVCLQDRRVSRQHCVFEVEACGVCITDLHSQNGTYLNGVRLTQKVQVHKGDTIRLGDTEIKIVDLTVQQ